MELINAVGRPCPIPVIEMKKAIKKLPAEGGTIQILVDNDVAQTNLEKLAHGLGHTATGEKQADGNILVTFVVSNTGAIISKEGAGLVVAIGNSIMGGGSDELGAMLMKSFIYSLTELDTPPEHLLFFNGGVHLTTEGSTVLDDLKTLADKGTMIDSCGACLNFYGQTEQLKIGGITNMYAIASTMAEGQKVINL